jgi:hypothetical protein
LGANCAMEAASATGLNGIGRRGEDGVVEVGDSLERLTEDIW